MRNFSFLFCLLALCGCVSEQSNVYQNNKAVSYPKLIVETPYSLNNLYEEKSTSQMYAVVAARVTNQMLNQTNDFYNKKNANLYIRQIKKVGVDHIPDGFYNARNVTIDIIEGSKTFTLVNNSLEADYIMDVVVNKVTVEGIPGDILQYQLVLLNTKGKELGNWMDYIRQVQNDDRSWW